MKFKRCLTRCRCPSVCLSHETRTSRALPQLAEKRNSAGYSDRPQRCWASHAPVPVASQSIDEGGQSPGTPEMLGALNIFVNIFMLAHCAQNSHILVLQ